MKADISITKEQITTILSRIDEEVADFHSLEGGFINPIYVITTKNHTELILRITNPLPKWKHWKTQNEMVVMKFLSQNTDIPVPKIWDSADTTDLIGYEYILMEKVEGTPMNLYYPKAPLEEKLNLVSEIISFITQMRQFTFPKIGAFQTGMNIGPNYDIEAGPFVTIQDFLRESLGNRISDLKHHPNFTSFIPRLEQLRASLKEQAFEKYPFVLTHSDLDEKNILVHKGKITALLDYEWAGSYPNYFELMNFGEFLQFSRFPLVEKHFKKLVHENHLHQDISENLRDFHEVESFIMCLSSYSAWFIGRELEGEVFVQDCDQQLDKYLKKYGF